MEMVEGTLSTSASFAVSAEQTSAASASSVTPPGLPSSLPSLPLTSFIFLQKQKELVRLCCLHIKVDYDYFQCLSTPNLFLLRLRCMLSTTLTCCIKSWILDPMMKCSGNTMYLCCRHSQHLCHCLWNSHYLGCLRSSFLCHLWESHSHHHLRDCHSYHLQRDCHWHQHLRDCHS